MDALLGFPIDNHQSSIFNRQFPRPPTPVFHAAFEVANSMQQVFPTDRDRLPPAGRRSIGPAWSCRDTPPDHILRNILKERQINLLADTKLSLTDFRYYW